jgi:TRAP-type C4-dicarboxylate transport system permease small subunit
MQKKLTFWKLIDALLLLEVGGMLVNVILQVISRLLGASLPWTEEMTRNLFVWTVFFGMAVGFRNAEHARVTFFINFFPNSLKKAQTYLYFISSVGFFIILAYLGARMSLRQYFNGETAPATSLPMFLVTLPISLCSLFAIIGIVQSVFLDNDTRKKIEEGELVEEFFQNDIANAGVKE